MAISSLSILSFWQDIVFLISIVSIYKVHIYKTLFDLRNIMMLEICFKNLKQKHVGNKSARIGKSWYLFVEPRQVYGIIVLAFV